MRKSCVAFLRTSRSFMVESSARFSRFVSLLDRPAHYGVVIKYLVLYAVSSIAPTTPNPPSSCYPCDLSGRKANQVCVLETHHVSSDNGNIQILRIHEIEKSGSRKEYIFVTKRDTNRDHVTNSGSITGRTSETRTIGRRQETDLNL